MLVVHCRCGARLEAADKHAGRTFKCPKCKSSIPLPDKVETEACDITEAAEQTSAVRKYRWCRLLRLSLICTGAVWFAIAIIAALGITGVVLQLLSGDKEPGPVIIILLGAIVVAALSGVAAFASAELVGGFVAYLAKHECEPDPWDQ